MRRKQTIIAAVLVTVLCAASALSQGKGKAAQEKAPAKTTITITNTKFEPKTVTIKAGSEVTWENKEGTHTVTADDDSWASPTLTAGKSHTQKFSKPGKYPYYCAFHGSKGGHNMAGVINVTR